MNLLATLVRCISGFQPIEQQIAMTLNDRKKVVEIMSDAAGEPAESFHFLRLTKLLFELLSLRDVFLQGRTHSIERQRHFGDLIPAFDSERVVEITVFECVDAFD